MQVHRHEDRGRGERQDEGARDEEQRAAQELDAAQPPDRRDFERDRRQESQDDDPD